MRSFLNSMRLPYAVWAIIVGTLFSRFGTAMISPYVTILLVNQKHLSLTWAGITLGGTYLSQAFGASLTGRILARFELFSLIKWSTYLYGAIFICLGIISMTMNNPWLVGSCFVLAFALMGFCRSIIETAGQTIISHITPAAQKNMAFSMRYTFINIGSALGPMVAILLGILNTNGVFFAAAICVSVYAIILKFTVHLREDSHPINQHNSFFALFKMIYKNTKLFCFIITMCLMYICFSQLETFFAYIANHYTGNTRIFAIMYAINGISIVLLQIPLVRFAEEFNLSYVIMVGIALLAIGVVGVVNATTHPMQYYISMIIFTLGEILSLSLIGMYIDQLATPENRHMYFGVSNFALMGRAFGPPLTVALCSYFGLQGGLYLIATLTLLGIPLLWLGRLESKPSVSH